MIDVHVGDATGAERLRPRRRCYAVCRRPRRDVVSGATNRRTRRRVGRQRDRPTLRCGSDGDLPDAWRHCHLPLSAEGQSHHNCMLYA